MKKNRLYRVLILACLTTFCFATFTSAQVASTVVDEQGELKDSINSDTTDNGLFLATDKDKINLGVTTKTKREMVGAVTYINPSENLTYNNTQWVRDYIEGLALGVRGSSSIRGIGSALFVIDGVIGRDPNILNLDEVEQITVLKDANAIALYGNQGKNGVIVINTKRGKINRKTANVNIRYGVKQPISLPNYVGSLEYMELYNEARANDGLLSSYDSTEIEGYRTGTNKYRNPDIDLYSDEYIRSFVNSMDVVSEFSNGTDKAQYYVNMGWNYDQSFVKFAPDANKGVNRFNVRGNVDFKVNNFITSSVDAVAVLSSSKNAHSNLLQVGTNLKPNAYAPFLPVSMIDTVGNPELAAMVAAATQYNGMLIGSTQQLSDDAPIGNALAGGYSNTIFRSTQFNNAINFDLSMLAEGLSAKTYLSFDLYDAYNVSVNNKFRVYEPTWSADSLTNDSITALAPFGPADQKDLTENVSTIGYVRRFGFYSLLNYQKALSANHSLNTTLIGYLNTQNTEGVVQPSKNAHVALQLTYDYAKKLYIDFSAAYINSVKLPEGNKGGLSPTFGLGYILSEEDFIANIEFIDFLKLKATGGVIKSDIGINSYFLYEDSYTNNGTIGWADGRSSNHIKQVRQGENLDLGFEERVDLNIGLESYLMKSIGLEFNYFKTDLDKILTTRYNSYPSYYSDFRLYENYDKDIVKGFELGVDYTKTINDFRVNVGGNVLYAVSEVVSRDEIYEYDYQSRVGKSASAIFGLVDQGFYTENDFDIDGAGNYTLKQDLPQPAFSAVQPGDIKYLDNNGDGKIDNNDAEDIGIRSSPLSYGLNFRLQYKGLSLFVLGFGQSGSDAIKSGNYYWVDGNDKYSEVVLGRWTPETASTATYPRLSSQNNSNNFRTSTFWKYDNSFFKIKKVQLTYEVSEQICQKIKMKNLSVNIAGSNLLEISKNKDIRQLRIGGTPQYRYFSIGLRTSL